MHSQNPLNKWFLDKKQLIISAKVTTYKSSTKSCSVNCRHLQVLLTLPARAKTSFQAPSFSGSLPLLCPSGSHGFCLGQSPTPTRQFAMMIKNVKGKVHKVIPELHRSMGLVYCMVCTVPVCTPDLPVPSYAAW